MVTYTDEEVKMRTIIKREMERYSAIPTDWLHFLEDVIISLRSIEDENKM